MKKFTIYISLLFILTVLSACPAKDNKQGQAAGDAFRASFCDPLQPDIIELGDIAADKIIGAFENIPWASHLKAMQRVDEIRIYYSPSLEIENKESKHGIVVSAVGEPDDYEFYIFYKRPANKGIFGTGNDDIITSMTGQTREDAILCLQALVDGNTEWLEQKIL